MVASDIIVEHRGDSVGMVTINRPQCRNALDMHAWRDLGDAFAALNGDRAIRGIVLTGAGGAFCAGDDIKAFAAVRDQPEERQRYWDYIIACYAAIGAAKVPVVAAVSGPCVGGGCTLALRADFRIADGTARFGVPPAKLGLVYPVESTLLLAATVGPTMAKHLLYTGELIDAQAAAACGLVFRVTDGDVVEAALDCLQPIIGNAPLSIEAAKLVVDAAMAGRGREVDEQVRQLSLRADASDDVREGALAFAQKRPPRFQGR